VHKAIQLDAYSRNKLSSYYNVTYSQQKEKEPLIAWVRSSNVKKKDPHISGVNCNMVPCTVIP
jgi:hypothetical protein